MKNIYKYGFLLLVMLMSLSSYSQDYTNRQKLDQLSDQLSQEYDIEYAKAEAKAKQMGWHLEGLERLDKNGEPIYNTTNNQVAANTTKTTALRTGKNVDGEGMKIGIWECCNPGGVPFLTHQDFMTNGASRITIADGTGANNYQRHATHVAGTMIASPPSGTASRGMAYKAEMDAYGISNHTAEMAAAAASSIDEVTAGKLLVSNHSYGTVAGWYIAPAPNNTGWTWGGPSSQFVNGGSDPKFGEYDGTAQAWDNISLIAPYYLIVKSAGNDRNNNPLPNQTVRNGLNGTFVAYDANLHPLGDGVYNGGFDSAPSYSNAKNIMTVGAVDASSVISGFSGTGPSDDGRIKPDICGMGVGVFSTDTLTTGYYTSNGTSMASPNVAGSLLLLQEYYRDKYKVGNDSLFMKNSTLKALAINTATDRGNPGPDYTYGFGVLNADKAGDIIEGDAWTGGSSNAVIIEDSLMTDTDVFEYEVNIVGSADFRVTLVYNDFSFRDTLVNDVDLTVKQLQSGAVIHPWKLDSSNPANNAIRSENDIDNVKHFNQNNLAVGKYKIRVFLDSTDTLFNDEPQDFSLVISGIDPSCQASIQHKLLDLPSGTYTAQELIKSQAKLVTAGREIIYQTNGKIELKPGFHAKAQTSSGAGYFKTSSGTCN